MQKGASLLVSAPSRIHCGLISVGQKLSVNFGGCGLMIDAPRLEVRISASFQDQIKAFPTAAKSIEETLVASRQLFSQRGWGGENMPPVRVELLTVPPRHSGFGTGTQLALAVGAGLQKFWTDLRLSPQEFALAFERGKRSAIGTYGFFSGGFLIDRGFGENQPISPLALRLEFPDWPILVVGFPSLEGRHGIAEFAAFDKIVATSSSERERMESILNDEVVPALFAKDFLQFCRAITDFGARSGNYYRDVQGGTFHSPAVEEAVDFMRKIGVIGVIQSSWGPSLAAFFEGNEQAREIEKQLKLQYGTGISTLLTRADNSGARFAFEID